MWISFDLHALPASVSLPALAPRPLRRFIATMRVLTPRRLLQPRRGIPASRKHTSGHSVANHLMQHCHSFQVPFLHLAISACVSPHEYGLHPTLAGSPHASSRIAFVSYGLSFPLPLLPTPPRGDAVTVGYKPERSIWRELSSLDMFAPTGARAPAARRHEAGFPLPSPKTQKVSQK